MYVIFPRAAREPSHNNLRGSIHEKVRDHALDETPCTFFIGVAKFLRADNSYVWLQQRESHLLEDVPNIMVELCFVHVIMCTICGSIFEISACDSAT
jgi:hypothetical protein